MAIIRNFYTPQQIVFAFELIRSDSLIYKKDQADYLNWFPCDFRLYVEDKLYSFRKCLTLSLEGLKNFIKIMEDIVKEKEAFPGSKNPDMEFKAYEYCATEGEFTIILQNMDEEGEDIVEITLWLNAAYYAGDSVGYYQGFRFYVTLKDLKTFLLNIRNQLNEIISE